MGKRVKYNELSAGDIFTVEREENKVAYMKEEYCYKQLSDGKEFKPLNGCTMVTKIGEML